MLVWFTQQPQSNGGKASSNWVQLWSHACGSEQVVLFAHVHFFIKSKKLRVQGLRLRGLCNLFQGNISFCLVHKHVYQVNCRQIFAPPPSPKGCFEHLQVTNHAQFWTKKRPYIAHWEAQSNESSSSSMFTPKA